MSHLLRLKTEYGNTIFVNVNDSVSYDDLMENISYEYTKFLTKIPEFVIVREIIILILGGNRITRDTFDSVKARLFRDGEALVRIDDRTEHGAEIKGKVSIKEREFLGLPVPPASSRPSAARDTIEGRIESTRANIAAIESSGEPMTLEAKVEMYCDSLRRLIAPRVGGSQTGGYKQKYLKYKAKYQNLKRKF